MICFRWILYVTLSLLSCHAFAQSQHATSVALPNPKLIHCHAEACPPLFLAPSAPNAIYPSQVLTDLVDGSVVGLTAIYEKSVSLDQLRSAFDALHPNSSFADTKTLWRVESEKIAIQIASQEDGSKEVGKSGTVNRGQTE